MPRSLHETDIHSTMHVAHEGEALHDELHPDIYEDWVQPKPLDAPPAREGYTQRWVRTEFATGPDNTNRQNKWREGWRPRRMETVPEEHRNYPTEKHASLGDVIAVGGLTLCEMPIALARRRNAAVAEWTRKQELAVSVDTDRVSREGAQAGMTGFKPITREEEVKTSMRPPMQSD